MIKKQLKTKKKKNEREKRKKKQMRENDGSLKLNNIPIKCKECN